MASWGVVAKQRNPSRIQVQGVANAAPNAAQTAPSKPLKAKQNTQSKFLKRLRGAWLRNSGTPAGFKSKGWPMRLQTCCPNGTFETPKSKAKYTEQLRKKASWGVVATQRNPSRIQVQGVASAVPNMVLKRHLRNPKSKAKYAEQLPTKASWGVVAKQRNPSRIQVQGVANAAPNMLPKRHLRNP